jgi:hypothetical protein
MSANLAQQSSTIELRSIPTLPPMHWTERYFRLVWGSVGIVGCLFCWQIGSSVGVFDPLFVSSPAEVARTALKLLPSPNFSAIYSSRRNGCFSDSPAPSWSACWSDYRWAGFHASMLSLNR